MFDVSHWNRLLLLLSKLQLAFKAALAVLHDDVLYDPLSWVNSQEVVNELNHIVSTPQRRHHLVLTRCDLTSLLCPLDRHSLPSIAIECFEHVA